MIKLAVRYVKPEHVQALREWLHELHSRRSEVIATFSQEGTRQEQAYLAEVMGRPVLIYVMDVQHPEQAAQAFKGSTLPIDLEHRRVMARVLDERVELELLYECATD